MDSDLVEFHPKVPVEEATSNRFDANQHVASAYASVVRTSFRRRKSTVSRIKQRPKKQRIERESVRCIG